MSPIRTAVARHAQRLVPTSRGGRAALVGIGVAAVVAAPLATGAGPASAVTIAGATSLTDSVSVSYAARPASTTDLHLLAFNDFHGNLEPASLNLYGRFAGGAAYLSKLLKDKQAAYKGREITMFAGDNLGAAPLANALFNEEPAVVVSNLMNVDVASVGNHEFDKGSAELLRLQNGGCPATGCLGAPYALRNGRTTNVFPGADFQYLSTNVVVDATGRTLLPSTWTKEFDLPRGGETKIGVVGEVLKDTPTIVTPSGVAGLSFKDEADAANAAVAQLKRRGVKIPVLVIHQGGFQSGTAALNGCAGNLAGSAIEAIAQRLDPSVKIIVSGHTHAEYRCTITANGVTRLVTSASSFGRALSDLTLTVDDRSGQLVSAAAENLVVENALNAPGPGVVRQADTSKADPAVQKVVDQYVAAAAPLANRVVGRVAGNGDLTRAPSPFGETTMGDVIADSQLAATSAANLGGAKVAFMNPGGVRADLLASAVSAGGEAVGEATYGELFTVQPFGNSLVTKTMTGAQIRSLLEQQFPGCGGQTVQRTLQISTGFSYEQAPAAAACADKIGRILLGGVEIAPTDSLRVTMNNFLATGGDGFTVFNAGTDALGGAQDIDALVAYFQAAGTTGVAVSALDRIVARP